MWYIFPLIAGLGYSEMAQRFAINDGEEAIAYLAHPVLRQRLIDISRALLLNSSNNASQVMGSPDGLKLCSCMTLFAVIPNSDPVFQAIIAKFFDGEKDKATLELL